MIKASFGKQIFVRVKNEIGVLSNLSKVIAEKGVNIIAMHGDSDGGTARLHFITADNLRIADALRAKNFEPREVDCVLIQIPNKPGMLKAITEKLAAAQIDVRQIYATSDENQSHTTVVLSCSDNEHALVVLNR